MLVLSGSENNDSFQLVVRSDGLSGLCIEHSAAEGIVIIQVFIILKIFSKMSVQMVETALRYMRKHEGNNLVSTVGHREVTE